MFLVASLVPFVVLVNVVVANPTVVRDSPISLRIAKQIGAIGATELLARDQSRARNFVRENCTFPSEGTPDVGIIHNNSFYVASVGFGTPPTYYNLAVDTGSSNTFLGAIKPYVKTNTSVVTNNSVSQIYGSANFTGTEYMDTVTIAPGLIIHNQSIGVASITYGLREQGLDGILGLGPANLTRGSLRPDKNETIPTVTDNLFDDGSIPSNVVSLYFEPTNNGREMVKNGELTFGGVDPNKFTGPLTYVPITTTRPSNQFWGFNQSIRYGDSTYSTPILDNSAGILDSGTTAILLATEAYDRYRNATGAIFDSVTGLLRIPQEQFSNLKPLFFTIGERTFEFTPNAQILPRTLNEIFGGKRDYVYLVVIELKAPIASNGLQFINGYAFLERFYSVYDTDNRRIGLAETPFTMSNIN